MQEELKVVSPNVLPPGSDLIMVVSQKIAPEKSQAFLDWQKLMTEASSKFEGYESTEVFPPAEGLHDEWITLVRFNSKSDLDNWVNSSKRAELNAKFNQEFGEFKMRRIAEGFDMWFQPPQAVKIPPWKMAMTILVALYPTLLLLQAFITFPLFSNFPHVWKMLASIVLSVSAMQWVVVPFAVRHLKWWHYPQGDANVQKQTTIKGAALIVIILVATGFIFIPFFGKA
ncbi:MAG: hypothetical protein SFY67_02365 [Candidatus Melainabacteria bacterium]|nr:hypothetical protein [Candidatus Melainabacteria bacterium]